jgi:TolB-like protein/DNA-binding winged helix-turn-helix (wHTH) protein
MIYRFGDCELDTNLYAVLRHGQTIRLRRKVYRICLYLLEHRDRVVSREELCEQIWPGQFISQATLEGVIRSVRQAVGDNGRAQAIIQTHHGCGYRFVASTEEHISPNPREEGPQGTGAFGSLGVATAAETGAVPARMGLVRALEAIPGSTADDESDSGVPDPSPHDVDSQASVSSEVWLGGRRPTRVGWRMASAGLTLGLVIPLMLGGWAVWWSERAAGIVPQVNSRVAVLPFIDLSAEADQAYFADGLTEELIAQLAQIHGLTVIARTSVMPYKRTLKDVATIGRELRVGMLLQGSVRRVDNHMRVLAQLIDVASQGHRWSQEYERELTAILRIQRDIARHLAQRLRVQLAADAVDDELEPILRFSSLAEKLRLAE